MRLWLSVLGRIAKRLGHGCSLTDLIGADNSAAAEDLLNTVRATLATAVRKDSELLRANMINIYIYIYSEIGASSRSKVPLPQRSAQSAAAFPPLDVAPQLVSGLAASPSGDVAPATVALWRRVTDPPTHVQGLPEPSDLAVDRQCCSTWD